LYVFSDPSEIVCQEKGFSGILVYDIFRPKSVQENYFFQAFYS